MLLHLVADLHQVSILYIIYNYVWWILNKYILIADLVTKKLFGKQYSLQTGTTVMKQIAMKQSPKNSSLTPEQKVSF